MRLTTSGVAQKQGRYLVCLRQSDSSTGAVWEFPGGKVEPGETPEKALEREWREELGLGVKVKSLIGRDWFDNKNTSYLMLAYEVEPDRNFTIPKKSITLKWVSLAEMARLPQAYSDRCIFNRLTAAKQSGGPLREFLTKIENDSAIAPHIIHRQKIAAKSGSFKPLPRELSPSLASALGRMGIDKLYSHQALSWDLARQQRHQIVVTPTASGKTLCYNLPVVDFLIKHPNSRALYLFPTKALAQDQSAELNELTLLGDLRLKVSVYDGDTPAAERRTIRDSGSVVITNPDMLHSGILPNHTRWVKFFNALAFVVIDEIHTYRGLFGSHVTNVLRRLKRLFRFYGSRPLFICCSATIGNPAALAGRLLESDLAVNDDSGAPQGEKHFIIYNPPLVDWQKGVRVGVVREAQRLALKALVEGHKTIVFARSRVRSELIADYIKKSLAKPGVPVNRVRVESYRGGYLPSERRQIEKGLRSGEIQGVVSTNALELGVDIGGLDVSVMAGFPGSIASTWQQAGRAGRRQNLSLALLIASAAPTDQYIARHPEYFFAKNPENGFVDPDNPFILLDHLKCAIFELPMAGDESFGGPVAEPLACLEEEGIVRFTGEHWYWSDRGYPAESVSLRSSVQENVVIVDTTGGRNETIGEMDRPSAKELLFEKAVYLHRGAQYQAQSLDLEKLRCYVSRSQVNYYTDAIVKTDIKVLRVDSERNRLSAFLAIGDVLVRKQVSKFKKIKFQSHENIGYGEIFLPEEEMHTRALMISFADTTVVGHRLMALADEARRDIILRLGYLLKNVCPVFLLCDRSDIGVSARLRDPHFDHPALYLYDNCPGGIGLAEALAERLTDVVAAGKALLSDCACAHGCPSCMGAAQQAGGEEAPVRAPQKEDQETFQAKGLLVSIMAAWQESEKKDYREL